MENKNKLSSQIVETPIKDFNKQINNIKKLQQETNNSTKNKTIKM